MKKLYPLKFTSIFKEKIWGGSKLNSLFSKQFPEGKKIGEMGILPVIIFKIS
jgi:mannose-6-phosphate isomerase